MNTKITALNLSETEKTALNEFSASLKKIWPQAKLTLFGSKATGTAIIEPDETSPARRKAWARLIQKIYEVDPLTCPKCKGAMKIISFIWIY